MCVRFDTADRVLVRKARLAADHIIEEYLGVPMTKAFELDTPRGFDLAVAELAARLEDAASESDAAAVRAAIEHLDVDWHATTAEQRSVLISRAMEAAGRWTRDVPKKVEVVFGDAAEEVVKATRTSVRRRGLSIAVDFNALDERIVKHLTTSQAGYITDEYGRRHAAFAQKAKEIVANGLESGLGRSDIAQDLERAAKTEIAGRGRFYWDVTAGAFVGRGRSFGQLSSYAEARIDRYVIHAVLDERTTEICRFLDGKTFSVGGALKTFERLESEPDLIKEVTPWVREALDRETGNKVLFVKRGEGRVPIAEVTRSAMGLKDERGEFAQRLSEQEMMDLGISFPPYHGMCRTSTLPL